MDRSNPYEAAFEGYLKARGLCYIGVDESRRALLGQAPIKNLDFIVLGACGTHLLVDVKGRRFPGGPPGKERFVWENWSTQEDIEGLSSWSQLFGPGYLAVFAFIYKLGPNVTLQNETTDLWVWQEERYLLRAVPVADYRRAMRVRSPKWGTVGVPSAIFRTLARPFRYYTHEIGNGAGNSTNTGPDPLFGAGGEKFHGQDSDGDVPEVARLAFARLPEAFAEARSDRP